MFATRSGMREWLARADFDGAPRRGAKRGTLREGPRRTRRTGKARTDNESDGAAVVRSQFSGSVRVSPTSKRIRRSSMTNEKRRKSRRGSARPASPAPSAVVSARLMSGPSAWPTPMSARGPASTWAQARRRSSDASRPHRGGIPQRRSRNANHSMAVTSSGRRMTVPPGKRGEGTDAIRSKRSAWPAIASAASFPPSVAIATPWPE